MDFFLLLPPPKFDYWLKVLFFRSFGFDSEDFSAGIDGVIVPEPTTILLALIARLIYFSSLSCIDRLLLFCPDIILPGLLFLTDDDKPLF